MGGRKAGSRLTASGPRSECDVGASANATTPLNVSDVVVANGEPCTARQAHLPRHGVGHCPGRQSPSSQQAALSARSVLGVTEVIAAGTDFTHTGEILATGSRTPVLGLAAVAAPVTPSSAIAHQSNAAATKRLNALDRGSGWVTQVTGQGKDRRTCRPCRVRYRCSHCRATKTATAPRNRCGRR